MDPTDRAIKGFYCISSFWPQVGDKKLTASRRGHMDSEYLESKWEQRNSGWWQSAHTPIEKG